MNGSANSSSVNANGNGQGSEFRPQTGKINCLKILALSLLREIASVEKRGEDQGDDTIDLHAEVRRFEEALIRSALIQAGGRQRQAARLLRTKITTLNTKIKRYNIKITHTENLHID
ncbi:MAG TPA: helix-turn-helix domain-containing protein [Pyrinomonadaceae bacterium]|nr:helix-turn-helix domain-containing protein [Pyrinomonadaceae bacterium]